MIFLAVLIFLVGAWLLLLAVKYWAGTSVFIGPFYETGEWIPCAVFGCAAVMASLVLGALIFLNRVTP